LLKVLLLVSLLDLLLLSISQKFKMQLQALLLLAASAVAIAETDNEGHHGKPGAHAWVKDFDNLVAFGDR
jgi:hypothetical protein